MTVNWYWTNFHSHNYKFISSLIIINYVRSLHDISVHQTYIVYLQIENRLSYALFRVALLTSLSEKKFRNKCSQFLDFLPNTAWTGSDAFLSTVSIRTNDHSMNPSQLWIHTTQSGNWKQHQSDIAFLAWSELLIYCGNLSITVLPPICARKTSGLPKRLL